MAGPAATRTWRVRAAGEQRRRNVPLLTAIAATAIALALLAVHLHVHPLPGVGAVEQVAFDLRFHARGDRAPASDRIVIVGLDDRTRNANYEIFTSRAAWGGFVDKLAAYKPKVIALDLFFDAPEALLTPELADRVRTVAPTVGSDATDPSQLIVRDVAEALRGDEHLATAITNAHNVYVGALFGAGAPSTAAPPPTLASATLGEVGDSGEGGARRPMVAAYVDTTIPEIAHGAGGGGAINAFTDPDGVVRRMPLAVSYGGRYYASLGLQVALAELGQPRGTSYRVGARELTAAGRALPIDGAQASATLDVLGPHTFPTISAADIMSGATPRTALEGKLVFVGFTYGATDKVATSLNRVADGVELHATLAENVLSGRLLDDASETFTFLITAALCALVVLAQLRRIRRRAWVPPVVALLAIAAYLGLSIALFDRGLIAPVAAPCLLVALVLVAATISELATEGREKAHLRATFSQYVSGDVVDQLLADPSLARLGGERRELTVLFSDIRGFSKLAEKMQPEQLAALLGEYLTPMTDLVLASGGTLDKYIGDAVMAMWSAPVALADHVPRACEVALRMQEELAALNQKWTAAGQPTLAIGVGLNTGAMVVGNMGSSARFDYTVIGDEVNLASRLEGLTKEYGAQVLVGEATARAAGAGFVLRELDVVRVSGRATAAPVFELVGRAGTATADEQYAAALALYRAHDFAAARAGFAAISSDKPAAVMAARCAVLLANPPPADWDGVYDQRGK
jgi:adenylate cyclase